MLNFNVKQIEPAFGDDYLHIDNETKTNHYKRKFQSHKY